MPVIDFPVGNKVIHFGRVVNPIIPLSIVTTTGDLSFDFLVDTGADCSMIPAAIAETELGIDLNNCPKETFLGIEGRGITVFRGSIAVKIGTHSHKIRCVFSKQRHCPIILGRMDIFDKFSLLFDNRRKFIRFIPI